MDGLVALFPPLLLLPLLLLLFLVVLDMVIRSYQRLRCWKVTAEYL